MVNRTDLALELQEDLEGAAHFDGIRMRTRIDTGNKIKETRIRIENAEGSRRIGKPVVTYITLECEALRENDFGYHEEISEALAEQLFYLLPEKKKILVAGLGNRDVTPDALGPYVIDHLYITGHLKEQGMDSGGREIYGIAPGVMAQTGMETSRLLKGVIQELHPEVLIAIDALSARNYHRLNATIQISDTGIMPGAGIGNHREAINEEVMGIPVIAIGVPTVIGIPTIVYDALEPFVEEGSIMEPERLHFAYDLLPETFAKLFVTPKNIDESIKRMSFTISEGINQWIFPNQS